jgi:hypothetical protein
MVEINIALISVLARGFFRGGSSGHEWAAIRQQPDPAFDRPDSIVKAQKLPLYHLPLTPAVSGNF